MTAISGEKKLVRDDIRYDSPLMLDAVFIYRLRAHRIEIFDDEGRISDVIWEQEYGGNNDEWRPYSGYETLDMDFGGIIKIEGRFLASIHEQQNQRLAVEEVRDLRDKLDAWLSGVNA